MIDVTDEVLVTGATGSTGAAVLAGLREVGHERIRVMVRKPAVSDWPAGVQEVVADFDDREAVAAALAGVRRAYLVTPSSAAAEQQQVGFAEQAAAAGLERLVLLSQLGARIDSPVRFLRYHAAAEQRVIELGLGHTFVRPNLFFQGLLGLAGQVKATNTLSAPIGTAAVSAVDVRDIGAVGAQVLVSDDHDGAVYTLTGPVAISHAEMAAELSRATGREISFVDVEPPTFAAAVAAVLPPWQVEGLIEDYAHYARGEAAHISDAVATVTGRPGRSFADFAADHAGVF